MGTVILTLQRSDGDYVEISQDENQVVHISAFLENLVVPALLAYGFHPETIKEYINAE